MSPATGDIIRIRSRQYLVEGGDLPPQPDDSTLSRLSFIEAGLIVRELVMRQMVQRVVIYVPLSVVRQLRDEMEGCFGLTFVIYNQEYVTQIRQERGTR